MPKHSPLFSALIIPLFSFFFLSIAASFFTPRLAQAQTTPNASPKTEAVTVSASVPDNLPPTTPILISPEDESQLTSGYVTFVWQESSDENGIKKYSLSLDGGDYIDDIAPIAHESSQYTLEYEASTGYYTLQVKNLIPDGHHTWKVVASDTLNNSTNSATWEFTLDTQAPFFVITKVGSINTGISAQDTSSIPSTPLELEANSPLLLGHGEINSTVVLTATIPDDPIQTFTATTDINGNWGQQLGLLPRDVIIVLDLTITDQAGLVSLINDLQIIIPTKYFVYPPVSPTPSPVASPPLIPGPSQPSPPSTPAPGQPPLKPTPPPGLIRIPLTPPIEIAYEILQEALEGTPFAKVIEHMPLAVGLPFATGLKVGWGSNFGLIWLFTWLLLTLLALIHRFGRKLSLEIAHSAIKALNFFPLPRNPQQGIVFEVVEGETKTEDQTKKEQHIPFALIELYPVEENSQLPTKPLSQVMSDRYGFYRGLHLKTKDAPAPEKYRLITSHPEFAFPTLQPRPEKLSVREFYLEEIMGFNPEKNEYDQGIYFIPGDALKAQKQTHKRDALSLLSQVYQASFLPLLVLSGLFTLIWPSLWNFLVTLNYGWQAWRRAASNS